MKAMAGLLLVLGGVVLAGLGLLFLLAAEGEPRRYAVAAAGLALGAVAAGFGVRLLRAARAASPEQVRADLLELARRADGELTAAEVETSMAQRAQAAFRVLETLAVQGVCRAERRDGGRYFIFPELQAHLLVRRCEFCNAELPLSVELTHCPSCGGNIKTSVEPRSAPGDVYRMDE